MGFWAFFGPIFALAARLVRKVKREPHRWSRAAGLGAQTGSAPSSDNPDDPVAYSLTWLPSVGARTISSLTPQQLAGLTRRTDDDGDPAFDSTLEDLLDAFHGMLKMCNLLASQNKALVLKTFNEQGGDEA